MLIVDLAELFTPALILDRGKLEANCARMRARCREFGVGLRPHMKTLKSVEAARIAIDPAHGGIAVSTLKEAEYFAGHGIEDIQLAVCITPDKLARAAGVARSAPRFGFFVDSVETARAVADFARGNDIGFQAWIEIDSGEHRTGLEPESEELIAIASALQGSPATLAGVATHGGHSYGARSADAIAAIAEQERRAVTHAAERLRSRGFPVPGVSAGSTPTAIHARSADGLTELRPGVYMAGDLFQSAIGSLAPDEIAVTVLATVISHDRRQGRMVIDAGGLALSKDRSTGAVAGGDMGYGLIADSEGQPIRDLVVAGVHQEHGDVPVADPTLFDRFPVGSRVRVLPNHVCMTTAMYDRYFLVDGATSLVDQWEKTGGW